MSIGGLPGGLSAEDARSVLGGALDGRVDPMPLQTRHKIGRTGGFDAVPFVWSGGWDLSLVANDREAQSINDLMEAAGDPQASETFRSRVEALARGEFARVGFMLLATEIDLRWHFACYHRIAVDIARRGFGDRADGAGRPSGRHPETPAGNPTVSIGPGGSLHWSGDGRHRVAIAHWLGLRSMPVTVRSVDEGWLREAVSPAEAASAVANRLAELHAPDNLTRGRSQEWMDSLVSLDPAPELMERPDPDGTNGAVERALRLHRIGDWALAEVAWIEAGVMSGAPPHVMVMAAHTALAAGDRDEAERRVAWVLAVDPEHGPANELASTLS